MQTQKKRTQGSAVIGSWLTTEELSQYLRFGSIKTFYNWICTIDDFPAASLVSARKRLWSKSSIDEWLASRKEG